MVCHPMLPCSVGTWDLKLSQQLSTHFNMQSTRHFLADSHTVNLSLLTRNVHFFLLLFRDLSIIHSSPASAGLRLRSAASKELSTEVTAEKEMRVWGSLPTSHPTLWVPLLSLVHPGAFRLAGGSTSALVLAAWSLSNDRGWSGQRNQMCARLCSAGQPPQYKLMGWNLLGKSSCGSVPWPRSCRTRCPDSPPAKACVETLAQENKQPGPLPFCYTAWKIPATTPPLKRGHCAKSQDWWARKAMSGTRVSCSARCLHLGTLSLPVHCRGAAHWVRISLGRAQHHPRLPAGTHWAQATSDFQLGLSTAKPFNTFEHPRILWWSAQKCLDYYYY